jgi:hypothetical protein
VGCLGVLFSLGEAEVSKLKALRSDEEKLEYLQEDIEETYFEQFPTRVAELDKSWDALHRSLTDGKLEYDNGEFPLSHVVLGGEILYSTGDYIMTLKTPKQVRTIADQLSAITQSGLKNGYQKIDPGNYGYPLTDEDFKYTWEWFTETHPFWKLAAEEGRYVLFTVDQ